MARVRLGTLVLAAGLAACGCQPNFTPPSQVHGVRVLAVHQDPASGAPGATVNLEMLVADDRSSTLDADGNVIEPAPLEIGWLAGCNNPPSRQYYACAPIFRALAADPLSAVGLVGRGTKFSVTLPDDILSAAPTLATDPLHYGVSYVFFAACGGHLVMDGRDGFPFGCLDAAGAPAPPAHFVIGFTTVYSYEGSDNQNTNPALDGVDFDGVAVEPWSPFLDGNGGGFAPRTCSTATEATDCAGLVFSHPAVCSNRGLCAPLVAACKGKQCPSYSVLPHVSPASFETFTGQNEVMWSSFYTSLGSFGDDTRLVDDRVSGPTRDIASGWRPPEPLASGERATSTIWVTLNDQRGGVTWASFDVVVQ